MRLLWILVSLTFLGVLLRLDAPARAQTYDPRYPVCMKVYAGDDSGGEWIDCSYSSLEQCRASASGRPAMCDPNPYFPLSPMPAGKQRRRAARP